MQHSEVHLNKVVNEVRRVIYVNYGIDIKIDCISTLNKWMDTEMIEIRWEEGQEKYQMAKVLGNYPIVGPPEHAWKDTAERLVQEVSQHIKDGRARRAYEFQPIDPPILDVMKDYADHIAAKSLALQQAADRPMIKEETYKLNKTVLLC